MFLHDLARGERRGVRPLRGGRRRRVAAAVRRVHGERRPQLRRARDRAVVGRRGSASASGRSGASAAAACSSSPGHALSTCRDWATATFRSRGATGSSRPGCCTPGSARTGDLGVHDAGDRLRAPARRHAGAGRRRRAARRRARRASSATPAARCAPRPTSSGSSSRTAARRASRWRAARRSSAAPRRRRRRHADAALRPAPRRRRRSARGDGGGARASATAAPGCRSTSRSTSRRAGSGGDAERLAGTAIVHVTPGLDGVSRAVNEAERGLLPARGDDRRRPAVRRRPVACARRASRSSGSSSRSCPPGRRQGRRRRRARRRRRDLDARSSARRTPTGSSPGSAQSIENLGAATPEARRALPADLEALNRNLVAGDIYAGCCALDQNLLWRPLAAVAGSRAPRSRASGTSGRARIPGPGLGAGSGYLVAKELTKPALGRRLLAKLPGRS